MERRSFIAAAVAMAAVSALPEKLLAMQPSFMLNKPNAIKSGDTIGVIAPATSVSDPNDLARAKEALDLLGLKMRLGRYVSTGTGYKTRSVGERLDDLHEMFAAGDIQGIVCIRGGYGSGQLLDKIDYGLIRSHPKVFIGYSDITALHLAFQKFAGLITFHGPMLLSSFTKYSVSNFQKAIFNKEPLGAMSNPPATDGLINSHPVRTIKPGRASGKTTGGNLSLVCSLLGTAYEIDTKGKILVIEDVGEEPYRIDRMLNQLRLADKFAGAAGVVIGECSGCEYTQPGRVWDNSLGEIINFYFSDSKCPVIYGLLFGHTPDQLTIPLGVEAELNADTRTFTIIESALR